MLKLVFVGFGAVGVLGQVGPMKSKRDQQGLTKPFLKFEVVRFLFSLLVLGNISRATSRATSFKCTKKIFEGSACCVFDSEKAAQWVPAIWRTG